MGTAVLAFTQSGTGWLYRGRQRGKTGYLSPTADDDYAANGLVVSAATFGMSRLDDVDVHGLVSDGDSATAFEGGYFDKPNLMIQFAEETGNAGPLAESNNTSLSGYKVRVTAWGA